MDYMFRPSKRSSSGQQNNESKNVGTQTIGMPAGSRVVYMSQHDDPFAGRNM
jgi:hypothetical protein